MRKAFEYIAAFLACFVGGFISLSIVLILFDTCLISITGFSLIKNIIKPFFQGL